MTDRKIWFITGAGRRMGVDFAKAALAAGDAVVATGRNPDAVVKAVGEADDLLAIELDVTSADGAERAVRAAVDRFARIDVLVNNAGNFYAGYFEELAPDQVERQLATNLIGAMNVARRPARHARAAPGHILSISSGAGLVGFEFCSAYAASKFGLEGWMESLEPEVAPFGIRTTIVEPASFRTEILTRKSATYAESAHTCSQRLSSATLRPQRSRPSAVRSSGHPMTEKMKRMSGSSRTTSSISGSWCAKTSSPQATSQRRRHERPARQAGSVRRSGRAGKRLSGSPESHPTCSRTAVTLARAR
jgi:NAD(P)-dependent dehydrogenase (short-subunit alcohol dehydrogenase family)